MLSLFALCAASAQQFDVASVKDAGSAIATAGVGEVAWGKPDRFQYSPTGFSGEASMRNMLMHAFGIRFVWQLDGPNWLRTEKFSIEARYPQGTDRETGRAMLRNLLIERFAMKWHRQEKPMPVYLLKAGPHPLLESVTDANPERKLKTSVAGTPIAASKQKGRGRYFASGATIESLATDLTHVMDRPVLDRTGLTGIYRIDLTWAPENSEEEDNALFAEAVRKKLGLTITKSTEPVELLVIDSISRSPSEN